MRRITQTPVNKQIRNVNPKMVLPAAPRTVGVAAGAAVTVGRSVQIVLAMSTSASHL
jgi:hypothetical protein